MLLPQRHSACLYLLGAGVGAWVGFRLGAYVVPAGPRVGFTPKIVPYNQYIYIYRDKTHC